jgi:hypothetical protein
MGTIKVPTPEDNWRKVKGTPLDWGVPSDDGRHAWIFKVACECTKIYRRFLSRAIDCERIEPEQDEKFIRDELTRPEQGGEIRHAVQNAYDYQ